MRLAILFMNTIIIQLLIYNIVSIKNALDLHWMTTLILNCGVDWKIRQVLIDLVLISCRTWNYHPVFVAVQCYFNCNLGFLIAVVQCCPHEYWLFLLLICNSNANACRLFIIVLSWEYFYLPYVYAKIYLVTTIDHSWFQYLENFLIIFVSWAILS